MEPSGFLVNGEWRLTDRIRPVVNPFDRSVAGEVCQASSKDIDDAIQSAVAVFQVTRKLQPYQRSEILSFIASEVDKNKEKFAQLITSETGKPIVFSRAEVERSIFTFTYASEEAKRLEGTVLPLNLASNSDDRFGIVRRFPLGPIAAITPFNFPLNLVAHKLAPAIATGNPVVLKPSSNAPLTSLMLAEVVARSPLPGGALNVVPCSAGESNQLVTDERIKLITFTGSPAVGWDIKNRVGKKRVVLELGGNAAAIVDKGVNLDSVVKRVAQGAYGNAGQSCIAVQRVYAHQDIYEEFEEKFVKISRSMPVGNPTNPRIIVGPMSSEETAANAKAWIDEAVQGGARVLCGGSRNGAILEPTVLVDVEPNMRVNCEEVFAPVVTLRKFVDIAGAIRMVNQSRFGLQAGIFSNDLQAVLRAYNDLEVGGLIVNDYPTYRIDHMPYGGVKDSGFGREGVRYAMEEMTELKLLAINAM